MGCSRELYLCCLEYLVSTHIDLGFSYSERFLSEASDKYITAVNRMNIVTFLSSFLTSSAHCPTRVVIAAGKIYMHIYKRKEMIDYIRTMLEYIDG